MTNPWHTPELSPHGVFLCGHGSRIDATAREFLELKRALAQRLHPLPLAHGFIEFSRPSLHEGMDAFCQIPNSMQRIACLPIMLLAGGHTRHDIPAFCTTMQQRYPTTCFIPGDSIDDDPRMLQVGRDRIFDAVGQDTTTPTTLLIVGRGNHDAQLNHTIRDIGIALAHEQGWHAAYCFVGMSKPTLQEGLHHAFTQAKRVVVLPYLLFDGLLARRIQRTIHNHPRREHIILAPRLGVHPLIIDILTQRATDALGIDGIGGTALYTAQQRPHGAIQPPIAG